MTNNNVLERMVSETGIKEDVAKGYIERAISVVANIDYSKTDRNELKAYADEAGIVYDKRIHTNKLIALLEVAREESIYNVAIDYYEKENNKGVVNMIIVKKVNGERFELLGTTMVADKKLYVIEKVSDKKRLQISKDALVKFFCKEEDYVAADIDVKTKSDVKKANKEITIVSKKNNSVFVILGLVRENSKLFYIIEGKDNKKFKLTKAELVKRFNRA